MPPELSFLISNMALVQKGSSVLDPFCGTGSLLLAASHYGARTLGCDLDRRVFGDRCKGHDRNLLQYNLGPRPSELMQNDMAQSVNLWSNASLRSGIVDAVISDPPYGIRAGSKKASPPALGKNQITDPYSTEFYDTTDILFDLTELAARLLRQGGRLVYWLPTTNCYDEIEVPKHVVMEVVANSEQFLSKRMRRRLVTLQKVAGYPNPKAVAEQEKLRGEQRVLIKEHLAQGGGGESLDSTYRDSILMPQLKRKKSRALEKARSMGLESEEALYEFYRANRVKYNGEAKKFRTKAERRKKTEESIASKAKRREEARGAWK